MKTKKILSVLVFAAFPVLGLAADAAAPSAEQQFATLREIAQKAVLNNPEVVAKWHNFRASVEEVDVASGGYLPRVDLTAGTGREYLKQPLFSGSSRSQEGYYDRNGWLVSLNQMLFDGFATRNEVKRLGKAQLVRYYELLDASEAIALEAAREVANPIAFAIMIIIVVFLPLFSLTGLEGKLFKPMALTITFAMAGSLLLSLTLVPVLAALILKPKEEKDTWLVRGAKKLRSFGRRHWLHWRRPCSSFSGSSSVAAARPIDGSVRTSFTTCCAVLLTAAASSSATPSASAYCSLPSSEAT